MIITGNFLRDLLGSKLSVESIKQYANQLKDKNQVPFIHFTDEELENELYVFGKSYDESHLMINCH